MRVVTQNIQVELESDADSGAPLEISYDRTYFRVVARWYCGEQRVFLPDNVEFVLANVAALPPNVWFQWQDTNSATFAVRRVERDGDERLQVGPYVEERASSVSYEEFLEAFRLAADPPDYSVYAELRAELDSLKSAAGMDVERPVEGVTEANGVTEAFTQVEANEAASAELDDPASIADEPTSETEPPKGKTRKR